MRVALLLAVWTAVAHAQAAPPACELKWYLEPSVFLVAGTRTPGPAYVGLPNNAGQPFGRVALGGLFRWCDGERDTTHLRAGVTGYMSGLRAATGSSHGDGGAGLELEVDHPVTGAWRLGGRASAESATTAQDLLAVGVRVHYDDRVWFGADAFYMPAKTDKPACTDFAGTMCRTSATGVMFGAGLESSQGKVVAGIELGILAIVGIVLAGESASEGFHL